MLHADWLACLTMGDQQGDPWLEELIAPLKLTGPLIDCAINPNEVPKTRPWEAVFTLEEHS